jgi:hypothetical protein
VLALSSTKCGEHPIDAAVHGVKISVMHTRTPIFSIIAFLLLSFPVTGFPGSPLKSTHGAVNGPSRQDKAPEYAGEGHNGACVKSNMGLMEVRRVDKRLLSETVLQAREYLFRVIDKDRHGVHKSYHADTDTFEPSLHTLYTSSLVYTLLKTYKMDADSRIPEQVRRCAGFILSMQRREMGEGKSYGAFHYSLDMETGRANRLYVVGTAAKTIFALLELHRFTGDTRYLESAKLAGQWLLTMQRPDGSVSSSLRQDGNGKWHFSRKFSLLYTGQVLSALSRMYLATGDQRYLHVAGRVAENMVSRLPASGDYVGDDYRMPNPVSSSWVVMSLLDFCRASGDARFENILFTYSKALWSHQVQEAEDLTRYGRWEGSCTSSGNGWLDEVMSELYSYCRQRGKEDCEKYRDATVKATRWILPHVCSDENMYGVKNPGMARGGFFWSAKNRLIRTDSVCHSVNAFINMLNQLDEQGLINVPEKPLKDIPGFK